MLTRTRRPGTYWPSAEQELLLRAAVSAGTGAAEAWRELRPRLDIDRADHAARRLLPLLEANLRRHGIGDPLARRLAEIRERTASRNHALFDAGRRILAALGSAGIDTMVLKGGALAMSVYPDKGLRPMADLDVLVPTARAEAAIEVLGRAGWSPRAALTPATLRAQHAADLIAEDGAIKCDLHWHVYWECCQPQADDALWASSVPLDFGGARTRMLAPADHLLHLCVHGSRRARRPQIVWVADALLLLRAGGIDWTRLVGQAAERRFALRAGTMLAYLCAAFAAPVPADALARLQALPVSRLERFEYWVGNRPQGLLGELPSYWCNYRRLRDGGWTSPPPGFARYLQHVWRLQSFDEVARGALARARSRARAAVLGPRPSEPPAR